MNATMHTFPPFQSMNSPRGWILAVIVLLHLGFFLVLSAGLVREGFQSRPKESEAFFIEPTIDIVVPPPPTPYQLRPQQRDLLVPRPFLPTETEDPPPERTIRGTDDTLHPEVIPNTGPGEVASLWTRPKIDPRRALSEPNYPARAIRENWMGTVLLSVQVLEDGRVGDVRVEQSSGYVEPDESAKREARKWRLKSGTKDGIPVAMWLQIPIKFELKDGSRF